MSQPENQPENQPNQPQHSDLGAELRELGQQIEHAIRTAIESDRAKQFQKDVSTGMKEIGHQVQSAIKSIQDNPRVQNLVDRGEQAVSQARQSQAAQDFQETLARGIAQMSEQLAAFAARMRSNDEPAAPPATGETTRLDEDK